jgi:hypothetical protein
MYQFNWDIPPTVLLSIPVQVGHCPLLFLSGFRKFLLHSDNHGVYLSKLEVVTVDQLQIDEHGCSLARWNRRIDRLQLETVRGLMYWQIYQVERDIVFVVLLNVPIQVRPYS